MSSKAAQRQPQADDLQGQPPFVNVAITAEGSVLVQTNITNRLLLVGLIEVGKDAILKQQAEHPAPQPRKKLDLVLPTMAPVTPFPRRG